MHIERVHIRLIDNPNPLAALFELDHPYIEDYWLSVAGPTSVAILRYVNRAADSYRDPGATEDASELSSRLGLGPGAGRWSALVKTLDRLYHFGHAHWDIAPAAADSLLAISIYNRINVVPVRAARRWSEHRQAEHRRHLGAHLAAGRLP
jgi:hypothetical protein